MVYARENKNKIKNIAFGGVSLYSMQPTIAAKRILIHHGATDKCIKCTNRIGHECVKRSYTLSCFWGLIRDYSLTVPAIGNDPCLKIKIMWEVNAWERNNQTKIFFRGGGISAKTQILLPTTFSLTKGQCLLKVRLMIIHRKDYHFVTKPWTHPLSAFNCPIKR